MALGHAVRAATKDTQHTIQAIIIAWLLVAGVHQEMMTATLMMRITIIVTPGAPEGAEILAGDLAETRGLGVTAVDQDVARVHLVTGVMTPITGGPGLDHQGEEEMIQGIVMMMIIYPRPHQCRLLV